MQKKYKKLFRNSESESWKSPMKEKSRIIFHIQKTNKNIIISQKHLIDQTIEDMKMN